MKEMKCPSTNQSSEENCEINNLVSDLTRPKYQVYLLTALIAITCIVFVCCALLGAHELSDSIKNTFILK